MRKVPRPEQLHLVDSVVEVVDVVGDVVVDQVQVFVSFSFSPRLRFSVSFFLVRFRNSSLLSSRYNWFAFAKSDLPLRIYPRLFILKQDNSSRCR